MKKLITVILATVMAFGSSIFAGSYETKAISQLRDTLSGAESEYIPGLYTTEVTGVELILSDTPSDVGEKLCLIRSYPLIKISEFSNGYGKTVYDGITGWVLMEYFTLVWRLAPDDGNEQTVGEYITVGGHIYMHESDSASSTVTGQIGNGVIIEISEISNGFGKTSYDGKSGWVLMSDTARHSGNDNWDAEYAEGIYRVDIPEGGLMLLETPSGASKKIGIVYKNHLIKLTEFSNGYGKTVYDGITGWIATKYLTFISQLPADDPETQTPGSYIVTYGGKINMYASGSLSCEIIGNIPNGTAIKISEVSNGFGKTVYGGKAGWVEISDLVKQSGEEIDTEYTPGEYLVNTTDHNVLSLFAEADPSAAIIAAVPYGMRVEITEISGRFGKTTYNGNTGWLDMKSLREPPTDDTETETETETDTSSQSDPDNSSDNTANEYSTGIYKVVTSGASLTPRETPSSESKFVACHIKNGTYVRIYGFSNGFGKTTYDGQVGWLPMNYLELAPDMPLDNPDSQTPGRYCIFYGGTVNMYMSDSASGKVIATIAYGEFLQITEISNGLGKTVYNNISGWVVMADLIKQPGDEFDTDYITGEYSIDDPEGDGLYLLDSTNLDAEELAFIPYGTAVNITEVRNGYGKTTYNGQTGWLPMTSLKKQDESNSETPVTDTEKTSDTEKPTDTENPTDSESQTDTEKPTDSDTGITGDVTGDGKLNMEDVVMLQKYIAKLIEFTPEQLKLADADLSGEITMLDVTTMQRMIAGLIDNKTGVNSTFDTM